MLCNPLTIAVLVGVLAGLAAMAVVGTQAFRAARMDPTKALRTE